MADEILKYIIQAETAEMVKGLNEAKNRLGQLEKAAKTTEKQLKSSQASTKGYTSQLDNLNKAYKAGNISQAKFEKSLAKVTKQEKNSIKETKRLENELDSLGKRQAVLNKAIPQYTQQQGKATKATANAIPVTQEFSRVIQDAPFGILGVGNNITQLVSNFGNLQRSAGGGAAALKLVGASLLGPGGLLLIISSAVTLLTVFSDKLKLSSSLASELGKATKDGFAAAKGEISTLQALIGVAQDETKSKAVRLKALEKLNDEYGDYLGNLTLETINTKEVNTAVDNLTRSLIKQAQVRGAQSLIEEKSKETAEDLGEELAKQQILQQQLGQEILAVAEKYGFLNRISQNASIGKQFQQAATIINKEFGGRSGGVGDTIDGLNTRLQKTQDEINSLQAETEKSLAPLQQLINSLTFEDILLQSRAPTASADIEVTVTAEEANKRDAKIQAIRDQIQKELDKISAEIDLVNIDDAAELARDVEDIYIKSGAAAANAVKDASKEKFDFGEFEAEQAIISLENKLKSLKSLVDQQTFSVLQGLSLEELDAFSNKLEEFGNQSKLFASGTAQAIQGITGAVADSVRTESEIVNSFINAILQTFGKYLSELAANAIKNIAIKQAESTANAVAAGTSSAASSGPAAAFVLPALIAGAVGAVFAAFSGIKFAQGGIVPGGGTGDRVPALLTPGEVVFNQGQQAKLLAMAEGRISSDNGAPSVGGVANLEGVLRGSDIFLSVKRSERNNKRFN
jgi:hypothetical protein